MCKEDIHELVFEIECDIVTLTFAILKLTGVISWTWFWVLSPIWLMLITKYLVTKNNTKK
jgi:hypothetical protein